jgi:hypothetical protein
VALFSARTGFGSASGSSSELHGRVRYQHGVRLFAANRRSGRIGDCARGSRQPSGRLHHAIVGMASIITWNGLSEFLTLLNAVANEPRPYKSGIVWYPHDKDDITIWLQDIRILLRGCPNKLSEFSGEIPHSGRPLPKKKLDASRIVGYRS